MKINIASKGKETILKAMGYQVQKEMLYLEFQLKFLVKQATMNLQNQITVKSIQIG